MRLEGGFSASSELPFRGSTKDEEGTSAFHKALRPALNDLMQVVRYCHPGAQVKKLEAMVWDPSYGDRYRKEQVPVNLERLQERLDEDGPRPRPYQGDAGTIFEQLSKERREELGIAPKATPTASTAATLTREVRKLHKPEDFRTAEAAS